MKFLNHYLIDVLNAIDGIANLAFIVLLMVLPCFYFSYIRDGANLIFFRRAKIERFLKYGTIVFVLSILIIVFMPSKESLEILLGVN